MDAPFSARAALVLCAGLVAACSGPDAPDVAVCRDMIHRLCLPTLCTATSTTFAVAESTCEADLLSRSGCDVDTFTFPDPPGRQRMLECRLALLRVGDSPEQHPDCADVGDFVTICGDVASFIATGVGP